MLSVLEPASLTLFCTANFLVLIVPGPAIMYTVTRSLDQGKRAGLLSVYGLALGTLPHALAVALGVAGLLASSVIAFDILRYVGAAYLVYLGIRRFRQRGEGSVTEERQTKTGPAALWESFAVGVLNPKAILFFLAFLPQFVNPAAGHPLLQILILWLISQVMAVVVGSAYALTAAWLRARLFERRDTVTTGNYLAGSVYVLLGLVTAFSGSRVR